MPFDAEFTKNATGGKPLNESEKQATIKFLKAAYSLYLLIHDEKVTFATFLNLLTEGMNEAVQLQIKKRNRS